MKTKWKDATEEPIPENKNVLAYSKEWENLDTNPEGIRIGFMCEDTFYSPEFENDYDEDDYSCGSYQTERGYPQKWMPLDELKTPLTC